MNDRQNNPCSCGSGNDYENCCGDPQALELTPAQRQADTLFEQAVPLHQAGRVDEADALYRRILELDPEHPGALYSRGVIEYQRGNYADAGDLIKDAVGPDYEDPDAFHLLGLIAYQQQQYESAAAYIERTLKLRPDHVEAHYNLGNALLVLQRWSAAEEAYRRSLALDPNRADSYVALGNVMLMQCRSLDAIANFRRATELRSDYMEAWNGYLASLAYDPACSPQRLRAEHVRFADRFEAPLRAGWPRRSQRLPRERLRIGFVSGDLNRHPVAIFLESVFANLDQSVLDVFVYPTQAKSDELTERLRSYGFTWRPLHGLSDDEAAQRVRDDGIDILVDLSGHTGYNRLGVFMRKPAPVQVAWLGYWATTGLQSIDYLLCDRYGAPAAERDQFVEQPWYLPGTRLCFTPPSDLIDVEPPPVLAGSAMTFGCFNNPNKLNDAVIALWARILSALPDARLLLKARQFSDAQVREALWARFGAHGVARGRVLLEDGASREQYLASYHRVDIALDPFPFTGGTTSVEGLWMGVPLITRRGDSLVSRQGESILHNLNLADWIAADDDEYVAIACARAADIAGLATLRAGLRQRLLDSPLCDAPRFARNLETAFAQMWRDDGTGAAQQSAAVDVAATPAAEVPTAAQPATSATVAAVEEESRPPQGFWRRLFGLRQR